MNTAYQLMRYEQGEMSDEEVAKLFQSLVDSGLAWQLQGHYGRTAARLLAAGVIHQSQKDGTPP